MPAVLIAPGGSAGAWQGHGSSAFGRSWGDEGDVKKQKGFGAMASCGGSHRHRVVSSHRGAQAAWSPQGVSRCCVGAQIHQECAPQSKDGGSSFVSNTLQHDLKPCGIEVSQYPCIPHVPASPQRAQCDTRPPVSLARSEPPQEPQPVTSSARREGTPRGTCPAMLELLGSCQLGKISEGCSETLPSLSTQHAVKCTRPK